MAGQNINRWIGTGNLTRDPEIKTLDSGTKLASLRIAVNGRIKRGEEWVDKANYFDVTVFGNIAEAIERYLRKGSPVAVDGRLDYQEWEKDGTKHSRVIIIADSVQFTSGKRDDDDGEPVAAAAGPDVEDDIPF